MSTQSLIENNVCVSIKELLASVYSYESKRFQNKCSTIIGTFKLELFIGLKDDNWPISDFGGELLTVIHVFQNYAHIATWRNMTDNRNNILYFMCNWDRTLTNTFVQINENDNCLVSFPKKVDGGGFTSEEFVWDNVFLKFSNFPSYSTTKELVVDAFNGVIHSNESEDFSNLVMQYLD